MNTNSPVLKGRVISTFFYYVLPSIIGLIAITTASLVDGVFVGNTIGADALAAITLLLPYFTLLISIALMVAIGGAVSAGKFIGEQDIVSASKVFSQSLIAIVCITSILAILSLFFESQLFRVLNIPDNMVELVKDYFSVIRWVFILQLLTMVLYYFVRADGHLKLATTALVVGAMINIVLDAWFILSLEMGLVGAAYATAIAQLIQFFILAHYFLSPKKTLTFSLTADNWRLFLRSAYNGISEFINELSVGLLFLLLNVLLISRLGIDGVAAFTVVNYFIFLSVMLCYGIADALHLLVSQNFGAKNILRMQQFLITAICTTFALGGVIIFVILIWQQTAISWFLSNDADHVSTITSQLILLIWPLFVVNGLNIILSCYLTAIHQPKASAIIALSRGLIFPISLLLICYFIFAESEVKFSFLIALPIAEWFAFFIAIWFCYRHWPKPKR
ncbi:MATE family efflux transporter [Psychromonas sp.]|nr:MATE family efflux transporter [Psychromonas sp.]